MSGGPGGGGSPPRVPKVLLLYPDAPFYRGTGYDRVWREALEVEGCEVHVEGALARVAGPAAPPAGSWDLVIPHVLIEEVTSFAPTLRAAALLEAQGAPLLNSVRSILLSSDKRLTHALWAAEGLPQPDTRALEELERWPGAAGRPLVLKPALGEAGRDAQLVRTLEAARAGERRWRRDARPGGKPPRGAPL